MSVLENWKTYASREWPNLLRLGTVTSHKSKSDITREVREDVTRLLKQYFEIGGMYTTLQRQYETLRLQQQKDDDKLRKRRSRRVSNDIAMNELRLENTTTRSNPSNLAIRYKELKSVEWLAAKEELDSIIQRCEKELVTQYLCDVFVEAMRISKETLTLFNTSLNSLLLEPVQGIGKKADFTVLEAGEASKQSVELTDMPKEFQKYVNDTIKERSDKCNIDDIVESVKECMRKKENYQPLIVSLQSSNSDRKGLETYISACCRLAWQMNVRTPAMAISVETDIAFDPARHMRAYDCESFEGVTELIDYYVWPTLFDAENELPVRQRGMVHTKSNCHIH